MILIQFYHDIRQLGIHYSVFVILLSIFAPTPSPIHAHSLTYSGSLPHLSAPTPSPIHAHSLIYPLTFLLTPACADTWIYMGEWQKPFTLMLACVPIYVCW